MSRVAVVGAGSCGTTLADLLAKKGHEVRLWAREPEIAAAVLEQHENPLYLRGFPLSPQLQATTSLAEAVREADVVVSVSPAQFVRRVMAEAAAAMRPDALVVSASKGIEKETLCTMAGVLRQVLPPTAPASDVVACSESASGTPGR